MYPKALLNWSGNRAGGVKKMFYAGSGRPSGDIIATPLLRRLGDWAQGLSTGEDVPSFVILVGGPGNGKTEAVEFLAFAVDESLSLSGALVNDLKSKFSAGDGSTPPRLVRSICASGLAGGADLDLSIVQDASVGEHGRHESPAQSLVSDLASLLADGSRRKYVACVNRGILDDALIASGESGDEAANSVLRAIVEAVSLSPDAPSCWPLAGYASFAVWPMDVETLVGKDDGALPAAVQILDIATDAHNWPSSCAAGERCPFCTSASLLRASQARTSLVQLLRWCELSSGKRWNFRDLFSLVSYLLAGTSASAVGYGGDPCAWAASLYKPSGGDSPKLRQARVRGLLELVSAQYQHALFGEWPRSLARLLRSDMNEVKLQKNPTLMALVSFLRTDRHRDLTATLRHQLGAVSLRLDPGFAHPASVIQLNQSRTTTLGDLDRRFSVSIREGREFLGRSRLLSVVEIELLRELEDLDHHLSSEEVRGQRPAPVERIQGALRMFACRLVRRSIGARICSTRDADVLSDFEKVTAGDPALLREAVRQVELLLNDKDKFSVMLNTTFGEPSPPEERQAVLRTDPQRVRSSDANDRGRPFSPVRFLRVGSADSAQAVVLSYDLYKATKGLRRGLSAASLPRSVMALLDTTKAKLAGSIVRDDDALYGSEIQLGIRQEVVSWEMGEFFIRKAGE